jgi:hypothetical protein
LFLSHTFYFPYMEIFGEHFLDDSPYFSSHPGGATERDNRVLDTILLCIYLLFSTIVLMNLLIARESFPSSALPSLPLIFDSTLSFSLEPVLRLYVALLEWISIHSLSNPLARQLRS